MLSFLFFRMKGGIIMGRRVKITLPENTQREVEFGGKIVKVDSYISLEKYDTIISDIKSTVLYNSEIENKYAFVFVRYIRDVLDLCTNIDVTELSGEDFNSPAILDLLESYIRNFTDMESFIEKEYDRWVMENCFGILANKIPDSKDMEESMNKLAETIENLPEDKLELIGKSIVWNNMPALGKQIAPAEHKSTTEA